MFFKATRPWMRASATLRRGDSRLLVLEALRKRPMHGYEVAKEISRMFGGLYEPSPGAIYPALQWLEDGDYVRVEKMDGKRVYSITEHGRQFLKEKRESLGRLMDMCNQLMKTEETKLFIAGRKLAQTLFMLWADGSEEKLREGVKILEEARRQLTGLMLR